MLPVKESEVFLVESGTQAVLFVPRKGLIVEVSEEEKESIAVLINRPQFSLQNLVEAFPEIDKSRFLPEEKARLITPEGEKIFRPDSATLFTTFDCNLRCIYCYANAGEQKTNMSRQIAEATMDFIIENAKSKGSEKCFLEFHGGGEPTLNWAVFQCALDRFQEKTGENGLAAEISLATNGMLSEERADWIAQHIRTVQVSLDGTEEIQNSQRPTVGGGKSFDVVCRTIALLLAKGTKVTIHSVVTEKTVTRIPEFVRFFAINFPGASIQLEPACPCGRGLTTQQRFPPANLFADGFIEAQKMAESFGVELLYSGANPLLEEFRQNFCGVAEPNFVVTPTGLVTACHEVAETSHPLAEHFIYGWLDHRHRKFVFDYQKIKELKECTTEICPACKGCFAYFYCAGDCLVKNLSDTKEKEAFFPNARCEINRELTRCYIFSHLSAGKEMFHDGASSEREQPSDK